MSGEINKMLLIKMQVYFFGEREQELWKELKEFFLDKISNIFHVSKDAIKFGKTNHGKPYILQPQWIEYNISHTSGLTLIAFSQHPIGVDVELLKDIPEKVLKRCYHDEE